MVELAGITVRELLQRLGECASLLRGAEEARIVRPAGLRKAGPDALTFIQPPRGSTAEDRLSGCIAGAVIVPMDTDASVAPEGVAVVGADAPRLRFIQALASFFSESPRPAGLHPTALIAPTASIDPTAYIGPYVVIDDDCSVGAGSVLHAHVHLYPHTRVGKGVTINSFASIGQDGFGYERLPDGSVVKFPHLGGVIIEDDVEIGACACIDRGALDDTIIRKGARIDNLVHVAHNCDVGEHSYLISQSHLGGSVKVGRECWIAPFGAVRNGVSVGDRVTVGMMSLVTKPTSSDVTLAGSPARELSDFKARAAALDNLIASALTDDNGGRV